MPRRIGLRELIAAAKPEECVFCGEKRAKSRTKPGLTCGDEICKTAYSRYYYRSRRESAVRAVVTRTRRPHSSGELRIVSEVLECGHVRARKPSERDCDTRICRECLTARAKTL